MSFASMMQRPTAGGHVPVICERSITHRTPHTNSMGTFLMLAPRSASFGKQDGRGSPQKRTNHAY